MNRGVIEVTDFLLMDLLKIQDFTLVGVERDGRNTILLTVEHPDIPATDAGDALPKVRPMYCLTDGRTHERARVDMWDPKSLHYKPLIQDPPAKGVTT